MEGTITKKGGASKPRPFYILNVFYIFSAPGKGSPNLLRFRNSEATREMTIKRNAAGSRNAKEGIPSATNSNTPYPKT